LKTYIDNAGNLILGDTAGGILDCQWNQAGATLTIKGAITITSDQDMLIFPINQPWEAWRQKTRLIFLLMFLVQLNQQTTPPLAQLGERILIAYRRH